jgi:hypothetical protein
MTLRVQFAMASRYIAAAMVVVAAMSMAGSAVAAGTREGDVTIVDIEGSYGALQHGGSATLWTLRLPDNAACPGDSMHEDWRIQTFLVPASVETTTLRYDAQKPQGTGKWPLYTDTTHPLTQVMLRPNDAAGKPGYVDAFPPMSFGVFPPGTLKDGTYKMGVACTYFRETAKVWDTQIVITSSAGDKPGGFVWRLASAPASSTSNSSSLPWLAIAAGSVVVVIVVLLTTKFLATRSPRSLAKDPS